MNINLQINNQEDQLFFNYLLSLIAEYNQIQTNIMNHQQEAPINYIDFKSIFITGDPLSYEDQINLIKDMIHITCYNSKIATTPKIFILDPQHEELYWYDEISEIPAQNIFVSSDIQKGLDLLSKYDPDELCQQIIIINGLYKYILENNELIKTYIQTINKSLFSSIYCLNQSDWTPSRSILNNFYTKIFFHTNNHIINDLIDSSDTKPADLQDEEFLLLSKDGQISLFYKDNNIITQKHQ